MTRKVVSILFKFCIIIIFYILTTNAQDCIKEPSNRKCTFGSKTPYRYIANLNDSRLNYEGCVEKKIWMVVRHGTRYPKGKNIRILMKYLPILQKNILTNYELNNSNITDELARLFYNWQMRFSNDADIKLGTEGETEMKFLAARMKSRFPTLFPENYDRNIYNIHHTATERTQKSAKFFSVGLFGSHKANQIEYPVTNSKTLILRFYKICKRWQNEIKKNPASYKEKTQFLKSTIVQEMLKNISDHLGFQVIYEDIQLIRMICVYETALYNSTNSPWCDIFSSDQLKILEYIEDIKYYWIDGYGYELTYEQACPALKDMFEFFQSNSSKSTTVYFTHSGTILKLLALMNIAKDKEPLTHDSFLLHRDNRYWRVSLIDAFASNIAFILYKCQKGEPSILAMHQERVVYLPGCPQDRPCPLDKMKELYVDNEEECRFNNMCSVHERTEL